MNNRDPSRPNTPQDQLAKPFLPFSIENILRKGAFRTRPDPEERDSPELEEDPEARVKPSCKEEQIPGKQDNIFVRLPWLAYTRYCPPKIPRSKPRRGNRKHKLDRNPRIPFSTSQLAALEAKFLDTHYLSSVEVRELSTSLSVTEHRVKIWFQNRRAREKKTKGACDGCTVDVEN